MSIYKYPGSASAGMTGNGMPSDHLSMANTTGDDNDDCDHLISLNVLTFMTHQTDNKDLGTTYKCLRTSTNIYEYL